MPEETVVDTIAKAAEEWAEMHPETTVFDLVVTAILAYRAATDGPPVVEPSAN